jgi:pyroglutamyl-peptidase
MRKLIITGFGIFEGVERNPTEDIVNALRDWCSTLSGYELEFRILVCSVDSVKSFITEKRTTRDADDGCCDDILIHLGVDYSRQSINLESLAYNNMTFRVPDQSNYQPDMACINENQDFDAPLSSDLDVVGLCEQLVADKWNVKVSSDPGRFLCNYVYYTSLCLHKDNVCRSLFIHVPAITVMALEDQILFMKAALNAIIKSVATSNA